MHRDEVDVRIVYLIVDVYSVQDCQLHVVCVSFERNLPRGLHRINEHLGSAEGLLLLAEEVHERRERAAGFFHPSGGSKCRV